MEESKNIPNREMMFKNNRYYTEVWLKYVRNIDNFSLSYKQAMKVKKPEDVYDLMINQRVGACFSKTYSKIAEYFEFDLLDYRKADKVYRYPIYIS